MSFATRLSDLLDWIESRHIDQTGLTVILRFGTKSAASAFETALNEDTIYRSPDEIRLVSPGLASLVRDTGIDVRVETSFDK